MRKKAAISNPVPVDAYEVAWKRHIKVAEAARQMQEEGWVFVGYNDYGQGEYVPPAKGAKNEK